MKLADGEFYAIVIFVVATIFDHCQSAGIVSFKDVSFNKRELVFAKCLWILVLVKLKCLKKLFIKYFLLILI